MKKSIFIVLLLAHLFAFNIGSVFAEQEYAVLSTPTMYGWDGTVGQWEKVPNAVYYYIEYDIEREGTETWHMSVDVINESFDFKREIVSIIQQEGYDDGIIKVRFRARAFPDDSSNYYKSDFSDYSDYLIYEITGFTKLDLPSDLRWQGTTAKWNEVINAEYYVIEHEINQNGEVIARYGSNVDNGASYDVEPSINNEKRNGITEGTVSIVFRIRACPSDDPDSRFVSSDWAYSQPLIYDLEKGEPEGEYDRLTTPEGLNWNGTVGTWEAVTDADTYYVEYDLEREGAETWHMSVEVINEFFDFKRDIVSFIQQEGYDDGTINVRFRVRAFPDDASNYYKSGFSGYSDYLTYEITGFTKLDSPSELRWQGTIAKWNEVINAEYYVIEHEINQNGEVIARYGSNVDNGASYDVEPSIDNEKSNSINEGTISIVFRIRACPSDDPDSRFVSSDWAYSQPLIYDLSTNESMVPSFVFPSQIVQIEAGAFEGTNIEYAVLPDNCKTIGSRAFANCKNLKYIQLPYDVRISTDAFEGSDQCVIISRDSPK